MESPNDEHGLRRPACCSPPPTPGEPEEMVWADSVASLFAAATRSATCDSVCQNHAVTLALRCTPVAVPWDAIVSARQARALLQAAVIASSNNPWDQPTNVPPRAALQSRYIFRLRQY